jgi:hypothetical protein
MHSVDRGIVVSTYGQSLQAARGRCRSCPLTIRQIGHCEVDVLFAMKRNLACSLLNSEKQNGS